MIIISEQDGRELQGLVARINAILAGEGLPASLPASPLKQYTKRAAKPDKRSVKRQRAAELADHLGSHFLTFIK